MMSYKDIAMKIIKFFFSMYLYMTHNDKDYKYSYFNNIFMSR